MSAKSRHPALKTTRRFVPDMARLIDLSPSLAVNGLGSLSSTGLSYETSANLNEITRRQLIEDINAYRYDLDFCTQQLHQVPDLSAHETRTIQLRILDLGHQVRHCQHRIEIIETQARLATRGMNDQRPTSHVNGAPKRPATSTPNTAPKRARVSMAKPSESPAMDGETVEVEMPPSGSPSSAVQRLGHWMCHLCTATKFLTAGPNRVPSAPCKWPLRDISKMLNHFLDMHTEHEPEERCRELGAALSTNRGPFEYWLTRTKTQDLNNTNFLDDCLDTLLAGEIYEPLRKLNRAASAFPNTISGVRREDIAA